MNEESAVQSSQDDDASHELGYAVREGGRTVGSGRVSQPDHTQTSRQEAKAYSDQMRQTVVADLKRLGIADDSSLPSLAREGRLDEVLNELENLPDSKTASVTAYMIPLIRAWQEQLNRPGIPPVN